MHQTTLPSPGALPERARTLLGQLGVDLRRVTGDDLPSRTPVTGETIVALRTSSPEEVGRAIENARLAFLAWRTTPAPARGDVVRGFGQLVREHKAALGELVSIETGKILSEGLGEVQELIDMCDFAVGLSRQLYGFTIASEQIGRAHV
jgi:aldehyde dehydrogenase (NAD+)